MAAVEAGSDGIIISDALQPDMPVIYVNPAFTRITGYSSADVIGRNCRFLQGAEPQQEGLQQLRKSLNEGRECRVTLHNFKKDGTPFWSELHIAPIRDEDTVSFFVGIQTDVTDRIAAQEESIRLQKSLEAQNVQLAKLNKTKNEFLGMAAHDLRNPLTNIVLATSILRKTGVCISADCHRRLDLIGESADFMLSLIDGLLDVSVIESGRMELRLEQHSLVELTAQTVAMHRQRAEEKGIELSFNMAIDHPAITQMDRNKIRQVLDNMVSNALKFSPPGSRTAVTVGAGTSTLWVAVSDTGPGIPPEEVSRLFQPFGRANTSPTGGERSTGLGLTISRRIAEAHGGRIEVDSTVGKGSTFRLVLPMQRE